MKQGGRDGVSVHMQLGEELGHGQGMFDVGAAGEAVLALVGKLSNLVGASYLLQIGVGEVFGLV